MPLTSYRQNTNGIAQPAPAGIASLPGPLAAQFQRTDIAFDYAIGGIPFIGGESLRGTYFRRIYQRSFSPIRKDQFDNQQVPGEQSIYGWWLRSQSSFQLGAGVQFLDTTTDSSLGERYFYSEGVDTLSTPGQVQLLQSVRTISGQGTGPFKLRSANNGTSDGILCWSAATPRLSFVTSAGVLSTYTLPALSSPYQTLTDDGTNYYIADTTGIWKGVIATPAVAATKIWNLSATTSVVLGWIKGRLVACVNNNVYELVGAGPTLPTAKFTHQNSAYSFTDISEIQTAILVSGNAGGAISQVHKFTLDSGGAMPTLTSGVVAAQMPFGEKILAMYAYIGVFVGIGTNKGLRVATSDSNGNLTYGPLVVQDPTNVGVQAIGGYDRFLFAGNQGNHLIPQQGWTNPSDATSTDCIIRVDLSTVNNTGSQPFANDLATGAAPTTSPVSSIANVGQSGLLAFCTGNTLVMTNPNVKVTSGFLYSSKIRYNTLEPKHFKFVYLRHQDITDGSITIQGQNPSMSLSNVAVGVVGSSVAGATNPFAIGDVGNAQEWFQFKFILNAGTTNTNYSPVLNGYQLRGLPGVSRQVLLEIPLLCFDKEIDRYGTQHGYDGYAYSRFLAVENLTASGNLILLQDLNYGTANLVVVDDYKFEQQSPELAKTSSAGNQDSNAHGGYIVLICRVIS